MGTTCLATCGPIYAPYLMQHDNNVLKSCLIIFEISFGRLISYTLFGLIAGALGSKMNIDYRSYLTIIGYLLLSSFLIFSTIANYKLDKSCKLLKWSKYVDRPFILGLITGISICPAFLIAIVRAIELGGPVAGMLFFVALFFGTNIFILPISIIGIFSSRKIIKNIGRVTAIIVGLWFMIKGINLLYNLYL